MFSNTHPSCSQTPQQQAEHAHCCCWLTVSKLARVGCACCAAHSTHIHPSAGDILAVHACMHLYRHTLDQCIGCHSCLLADTTLLLLPLACRAPSSEHQLSTFCLACLLLSGSSPAMGPARQHCGKLPQPVAPAGRCFEYAASCWHAPTSGISAPVGAYRATQLRGKAWQQTAAGCRLVHQPCSADAA